MGTQSMHHISRNGEALGEWTVEVIAQKLAASEIAITDFAWDADKNDWVTLMEFAPLKTHLQAKKPAAPPKPASTIVKIETPLVTSTHKVVMPPVQAVQSISEETAMEWYVNRSGLKFGPLSYLGVVKALQDKAIFEFDQIWKEGMEKWVRLAEHEKFSADAIRTLMVTLEQKRQREEVFAMRKHTRLQVQNTVLVHDNKSVSQGQMVEASIGGSGLIIQNATLMPGQIVNVHFSTMDDLPAFNAMGEIVSKKFVRSARNQRTPIHYGMRFVKMNPEAEKQVLQFIKARSQNDRTSA